MRDVLIHGYMGVDLDAVRQAATVELPPLGSQIEAMLKSRCEIDESSSHMTKPFGSVEISREAFTSIPGPGED